MFNKERLKGIIIGVIITLILVPTCSAFATPLLKQISVRMGGIKIVVDGETIIPKDADGNVVEPIIYNGTTYLPLRALTQAITKGTKPVDWDQANWTVYIGERNPSGRTVKINDLTPISGNGYFGVDNPFEVRQNKYTPFNEYRSGKSPTYLLKGKYAKLKGNLAIDDRAKDEKLSVVLRVYTNSLIDNGYVMVYKSKPVKWMEDPISIEVPLAAADKMFFTVTYEDDYYDDPNAKYFQYNGYATFFNIELVEESEQ